MKSRGGCCPKPWPPPAPVLLATSSTTTRAVVLKIRRVDMNAFSLPDEKLPPAPGREGERARRFSSSTRSGGLRGFGNVIQRNGRRAQVEREHGRGVSARGGGSRGTRPARRR